MSAADLLTLAFWTAALPAAAGLAVRCFPERRRAALAVAAGCPVAAVCGAAAAAAGWGWPPAPPLGVLAWAVPLLAGAGALRGPGRWLYLLSWMVAAELVLLRPVLARLALGDAALAAAFPLLAATGAVLSDRSPASGFAVLAGATALALGAAVIAGLGASARLAQFALPLAVLLGAAAAARAATGSDAAAALHAVAAGTGATVVLAARTYADLPAAAAWLYAAALALPPWAGRSAGQAARLASMLALLAAAAGLAARDYLAGPA